MRIFGQKPVVLKPEFDIPLHAPCLGNDNVTVRQAGRHGVRALEKFWQSRFGLPAPVALQSGTAALHLALRILGIAVGDRVLVPVHTYVATVAPLLYERAVPVLVDSEPETLNMSPRYAEEAIQRLTSRGQKPKAMIVAHLYGMAARIEDFVRLAETYDMVLIEDAAESVGTSVGEQLTGSFGQAGIWSFNINKIFSGLGGGALLVQKETQAVRARKLATHAREDKPYFYHKETGYNYQMHPVAARLIHAQMQEFDRIIARKRNLHETYRRLLRDLPLMPIDERPGSRSNYWLNAFLLPEGMHSKDFVGFMQANGIEVRHFWFPLHRMELFGKYEYVGGNEAEKFFNRGVLFPSSPCLTAARIERIADTARRFFGA